MAGFTQYKVHFEHPRHRSVSIYTMELDPDKAIAQLKEELSMKFHTPPEQQVWKYQSQVLSDESRLRESGIDVNGFIEVKVATGPR